MQLYTPQNERLILTLLVIKELFVYDYRQLLWI